MLAEVCRGIPRFGPIASCGLVGIVTDVFEDMAVPPARAAGAEPGEMPTSRRARPVLAGGEGGHGPISRGRRAPRRP